MEIFGDGGNYVKRLLTNSHSAFIKNYYDG